MILKATCICRWQSSIKVHVFISQYIHRHLSKIHREHWIASYHKHNNIAEICTYSNGFAVCLLASCGCVSSYLIAALNIQIHWQKLWILKTLYSDPKMIASPYRIPRVDLLWCAFDSHEDGNDSFSRTGISWMLIANYHLNHSVFPVQRTLWPCFVAM